MAVILLVNSVGHAQDKEKAPAGGAALKTTAQQASYGIGLDIGRNMKANAPDLDAKALAQGITDAFAGLEPKLTEEQVTAAMQAFQAAMEAKAAERNAKNKRDGEAYLVANKKKEGVVTLPSGLQYKVIKKGNGAKPKATDTVRTHYHGTLISGEVFDSSVERGEPATFAVGGVIRGWTEALQLMPVGSKWRLFVPAALAYGPQARGAAIGPNSTLIFEIELLAIE
jgi:FKBP-type peptidyl-prolyl cis-trans isomerase